MSYFKRKTLLFALLFTLISSSTYAIEESRDTFIANNPNNILERDFESDYFAEDNTARKSIPVVSNNSNTKIIKEKTKPAYTSGTITENVGEDGKEFDKNIPPIRQFLTFQTNDGKDFHLIIDYLKDTQQVRMLTEVSQSDLLNMIDTRLRDGKGNTESPEAMEKRIRSELEAEYREKEQKKERELAEQKKLEEKKSKKNKKGNPILLIIVAVIVFIIAYFKKFKNKDTSQIDDKHDVLDDDEFNDFEDDDFIDYNDTNNEDTNEENDNDNDDEE